LLEVQVVVALIRAVEVALVVLLVTQIFRFVVQLL
jgi:hypothetical protein